MTTHVRASAGKGFIMKVVRTRIAVALGCSAVVASAFGLTAFVGISASPRTPIPVANQSVGQPSPNTTIYDQ